MPAFVFRPMAVRLTLGAIDAIARATALRRANIRMLRCRRVAFWSPVCRMSFALPR